jgi:hypothetical protein
VIDLQKYCGSDKFRSYLNRPFSTDDFTYATDGRIMVRVDRLPFDPPSTTFAWDAPFKGMDTALFGPLPHKTIAPFPLPTEEDCPSCDGRGVEHDCPDCSCDCEDCDGVGLINAEPEISTTVRGGTFNLKYVALMLELPNVLVQTNRTDMEGPLLFKFDGGIGAIMPRREPFKMHVEIEKDLAA